MNGAGKCKGYRERIDEETGGTSKNESRDGVVPGLEASIVQVVQLFNRDEA